MKIKQKDWISVLHRARVWRGAGVAVVAWLALGGTALAGPFDLGHGVRGHWNLTVGYNLAVRTQGRAHALIDSPAAINADDGDRNFHAGSLVHNRATALAELHLSRDYGAAGKYGVVVRGDAFYDQAYHGYNANNSPATANKSGKHDRFTSSARVLEGGNARVLDAYVHGTWQLSQGYQLNLRVGRQVVAWGQSLFFSGLAAMQGPADATQAEVPGVEVKNILLPVNQVSMHFRMPHGVSLLAYYRLQFKPTEVDPAGAFMSTSDLVGAGAQAFRFASGQPLGPLNALPRVADDQPSDFGQWGVGLKYRLNWSTTVGGYYIRYSNPNPELVFTSSNYYQRYYDGIDMYAVSFSTTLGPVNVAGEASYRKGVDMLSSNALATRGKLSQLLASAIYTMPPNFVSQQISVVGEVGYIHVNSLDADAFGSHALFNSKNAWGFEGTATLNYFNVFNGVDVNIPLTFAMIAKGDPAMAGAFGALYGEGDQRVGLGANFVYLSNLTVGVSYNLFLGSPSLDRHPYADRDFAGFNIKYTF